MIGIQSLTSKHKSFLILDISAKQIIRLCLIFVSESSLSMLLVECVRAVSIIIGAFVEQFDSRHDSLNKTCT